MKISAKNVLEKNEDTLVAGTAGTICSFGYLSLLQMITGQKYLIHHQIEDQVEAQFHERRPRHSVKEISQETKVCNLTNNPNQKN